MPDDEEKTKEDEICLHASLSSLKAYLTDFGSSNHMVASRKYVITFPLSRGPSIHMGYDSKISYVERGSDKIQHDEFIPSPTEKQNVKMKKKHNFPYSQFELKKVSFERLFLLMLQKCMRYMISHILTWMIYKNTFESLFLNKITPSILCKNSPVIL